MKNIIQKIAIGAVALLLTLNVGCSSFVKTVFPLAGNWSITSMDLELQYLYQATSYKFTRTNANVVNSKLDFTTDSKVVMINTNYGYRTAKVNGVDRVILTDASTGADVFDFAYQLNDNKLKLTSANVLEGNTARARLDNAIGLATLFTPTGISAYPNLSRATDATSAILTINAIK